MYMNSPLLAGIKPKLLLGDLWFTDADKLDYVKYRVNYIMYDLMEDRYSNNYYDPVSDVTLMRHIMSLNTSPLVVYLGIVDYETDTILACDVMLPVLLPGQDADPHIEWMSEDQCIEFFYKFMVLP